MVATQTPRLGDLAVPTHFSTTVRAATSEEVRDIHKIEDGVVSCGIAGGLVASNDIVIRRTNQDNTPDTIPACHIILDHRSR